MEATFLFFFLFLAHSRVRLITAQHIYTEKDWGHLSPIAINLPIYRYDLITRLCSGRFTLEYSYKHMRSGLVFLEGWLDARGDGGVRKCSLPVLQPVLV